MRACWRNCALSVDEEMRRIDLMEDELGPLSPPIARIRALIGALEICHHKAARWLDNILQAIAAGDTRKGLGTRPPGQRHAAEAAWAQACAELEAWCEGRPSRSVLTAALAEPTELKRWQVRQVIRKIRSVIAWPQPEASYDWLLLGGSEYEASCGRRCPAAHQEDAQLWEATARTIIRDELDGEPAALSLALAIDMLWPCHWNFASNLAIVLPAIGGGLTARAPFAASGRNIASLPLRRQLQDCCAQLRAYGQGDASTRLGPVSAEGRWLAASLDKTIRLQLDPSPDLRAASALRTPDWSPT